ncbi:MAG: pyruvate kinase [Candidatus Omnitrophica bacterium]|nr:pyruvate kinase [Candidatus Omnitrophota bacterium]MBU1630508.1 pyruvate kinase [Candidatus Omnitrophota bacterium]MBU1767437.1 pyruvate kinase [Candidatus Omnitrophota bacterium]MBU1888470.1 pyruvate kinase [Candidatus Omnitrophota bacterium]
MTRTKIICTLGPASSNQTVLRKMMLAGMDVGRLNFSHGGSQDLLNKIDLIRLLNTKYRRRIKFLGDLQGHRIRVGELTAPLELKKRKVFWLTQEKIKGTSEKIPFDYQGSLRSIKNGQYIFIDDGNIALEVIGRTKTSLKTKVIVGGLLKEHKGINIPGVKLQFGSVSQKDIQDILFCKRNNIEYIAQSFVCTKKDILDIRNILGKNSRCKIIAKIESREGIKNIDEIIKVSDGIMIARGDMGVSLPVYKIPVIQKMIIKKCNKAKKFVITATQMLESMTDNRIPTRAEVSDVANAIIDGTNCVMLSAESAVGKYPVQTVSMMNDIIKFTEKYLAGKAKTVSGLI